jgi:hypothetical protein
MTNREQYLADMAAVQQALNRAVSLTAKQDRLDRIVSGRLTEYEVMISRQLTGVAHVCDWAQSGPDGRMEVSDEFRKKTALFESVIDDALALRRGRSLWRRLQIFCGF